MTTVNIPHGSFPTFDLMLLETLKEKAEFEEPSSHSHQTRSPHSRLTRQNVKSMSPPENKFHLSTRYSGEWRQVGNILKQPPHFTHTSPRQKKYLKFHLMLGSIRDLNFSGKTLESIYKRRHFFQFFVSCCEIHSDLRDCSS